MTMTDIPKSIVRIAKEKGFDYEPATRETIQEWLREKHKLVITITPHYEQVHRRGLEGYTYALFIVGFELVNNKEPNPSYTAVIDNALRESIDLIRAN